MIGACLSRNLIVAALNFRVCMDIVLIQLFIGVFQFANLRFSQLLKYIRRIVPHHIFAPLVSSLRQKSLIIIHLLVALVCILLYPVFLV